MIKRIYHSCGEFLDNELYRYVKIITGLFLALSICMVVYFRGNMNEAEPIVTAMQSIADTVTSNGALSVPRLILQNVRASSLMVVSGLLPFLFLPILFLLSNTTLIGAVVAVAMKKASLAAIVLGGLMPHGILELPALFICLAMGAYICVVLSNKIVRHKTPPIKDVLFNCIKTYVFVVIPLLIGAGIIETYLTPLVFQMFV